MTRCFNISGGKRISVYRNRGDQVPATCSNISSVCGAIDRQYPERAVKSGLVLDRVRPGEQAPELPALFQRVSVPF